MNRLTEDSDPEIFRIETVTRELERVNGDIDSLLSKLPLPHYGDVARLHTLIDTQLRLVSIVPRRKLPPRVMVFLDNAKDFARHLRSRYFEAVMNGRVRKPLED
jgi:hypothetical protein